MDGSEEEITISSITGHDKMNINPDTFNGTNFSESENVIRPVLVYLDHVKDKCSENFSSWYEEEMKKNCFKSEEFGKKFDKNNNLLIFCKNKNSANEIAENKELFSGSKKLDLNKVDLRNSVIIKGIKVWQLNLYKDELIKAGLSDFIFVGKEKKILKAFCADNEIFLNLIRDGLILSFNIHFEVLVFVKNPVQCINCRKFGHRNCTENLCYTCNVAHTHDNEENKCNREKSCMNCSKNHSSFWKGCHVFKQIKEDKAKSIIERITKSLSKDSKVDRDYSNINLFQNKNMSYAEMTKGVEYQSSKLEKQIEKQNEQLESLNKKFDELKSSLDNQSNSTQIELKRNNVYFQENIMKNNIDIVHFIVSVFNNFINTNEKNKSGTLKSLNLKKISEISNQFLGIEIKNHESFQGLKESNTSNTSKRGRTSDITSESIKRSLKEINGMKADNDTINNE